LILHSFSKESGGFILFPETHQICIMNKPKHCSHEKSIQRVRRESFLPQMNHFIWSWFSHINGNIATGSTTPINHTLHRQATELIILTGEPLISHRQGEFNQQPPGHTSACNSACNLVHSLINPICLQLFDCKYTHTHSIITLLLLL